MTDSDSSTDSNARDPRTSDAGNLAHPGAVQDDQLARPTGPRRGRPDHERAGLPQQARRTRILPAPPIAELFGLTIESVEPGDVVFRCAPDESTYNPIGVVHGGLACVLLDTVAGCAVHSTLPAGVGYTSLEIKVNYLRPIHGGIALIAHGWVTKPGRRAAFAEGDIRDPDGKVLATASSTCLVMG